MKALSLAITAAAAGLLACASSGRTPSPSGPPPLHGGSAHGAVEGQAAGQHLAADSLTSEEIARQAVNVFGDSLGPEVPGETLIAGGGEEDTEPTWDIDVRSYETHARVEHYVRIFSGNARERIAERLERGTRYEPMIRTKLKAAGLPEDMIYLALIESGFNPHAYSRAAAVGMWQFMTSTARGVGMRVDWWVDERRDPARSTDGAIRFLKILNQQFGSLYLAAAAYNGGPGRISRGLSRHADELEGTSGDDLFFALAETNYLRSETREYVPQLIAAALVGKNPARYGLTIRIAPPFVYDSVRVGPATPLAAVASASGSSLEDVLDLNPHVLRGTTPPSDSFFVRVPLGRSDDFASAFAELEAPERTAFKRVMSKKDEYLATIARRHGVTATQLGWYNPKLRKYQPSGKLIPDQTVLIPSPAVVAAARDVPDPSIERYAASQRVHIVKRGETLSHIARRYNTSVNEIMRLNRLRKTLIVPGQSLIVSGSPRRARR